MESADTMANRTESRNPGFIAIGTLFAGLAAGLGRAEVLPPGNYRPELNTITKTTYNEGTLISNGSFESGTSGWTFVQSGSGTSPAGKYPYSGRSNLELGLGNIATPIDFIKSAVILLEPSTQYTLSFYYRTYSIPAGNLRPNLITYSGIQDNAASDLSAPYLQSQPGWTYYQHTFTTGSQVISGAVSLVRGSTFSFPPSDYALAFDEVVFVKGPDPLRSKIVRSVDFMDGMNRPTQGMVEKAGGDLYTETTYDQSGRPVTQSLPLTYPGGHSYLSGITFNTSGSSKLDVFYGPNAEPAMRSSGFAYTETQYENSPLGRVRRVLSPGGEWGPSQSKRKYYASTEGTLPSDWPSGMELDATRNSEFVEMTLNEQGDASRTYSDLFGRIVMREAKLGSDWIQTYSQYNGAGNLVSETAAPGHDGQSVVTTFTFNSLNHKRSENNPETGLISYTYDRKGNLRFTQTLSQLLKGHFTYLKYDSHDRLIESGEYLDDGAMDQENADNTSFPFSGIDKVARIMNFYDKVPMTKNWCQESPTSPIYYIRSDANINAGNEFFDLNSAYDAVKSVVANSATKPASVTFYQIVEPPYPAVLPILGSQLQPFQALDGSLVPWQLKRIERGSQEFEDLTGAPFPYSVNWGPLEGRLVQTVTCNMHLANTPVGVSPITKTINYDKYGNAVDVFEFNGYASFTSEAWQKTSMVYDQNQRLVEKRLWNSPGGYATDIKYTYSYDQMGRLERVEDEENNVVLSNQYNGLGQLSSQQIGVLPGRVTANYKYHFRGWPKEIEYKDTQGQILYKQTLRYQDGDIPRFGGDLSEFTYQNLIMENAKYSLEYDDLGRMTKATSLMAAGASQTTKTWIYDFHDNGSIDGMTVNGQDFDYQYYGGTNQVEKVAYSGNHPRHFNQTLNFSYDSNGRMKNDKSKKLFFDYDDFTGRPYKSRIEDPDWSTQTYYVHGADGSRVAKLTKFDNYDGMSKFYWSNGKETRYIEGYLSEILPMDGAGRVERDWEGNRQYEAYVKNHLGSTVKVHNTTSNVTVFKTDYEPYGKQAYEEVGSGYTESLSERFTGKEKDEETDLSYFGSRYYDADLGIWTSPDPRKQFHNPYAYSPKPLSSVDPDGEQCGNLCGSSAMHTMNYWMGLGMIVYRDNLSEVVSMGEDASGLVDEGTELMEVVPGPASAAAASLVAEYNGNLALGLNALQYVLHPFDRKYQILLAADVLNLGVNTAGEKAVEKVADALPKEEKLKNGQWRTRGTNGRFTKMFYGWAARVVLSLIGDAIEFDLETVQKEFNEIKAQQAAEKEIKKK